MSGSERPPEGLEQAGALAVLRAGLAQSPQLRVGLGLSVLMAAVSAVGRLSVPVVIQQVVDRVVLAEDSSSGAVAGAVGLTAVVIVGVWLLTRATMIRLVTRAEAALAELRVAAFAHVHRLSLATHDDTAKGALVTRVTSDVDALARFVEWGAIAWIVNSTMISFTCLVLGFYSWQLLAVTLTVFVPVPLVFRFFQRRQLRAYDEVRTAVATSATEFSEQLTGAAVVRAYGLQQRSAGRIDGVTEAHYRRRIRANRYFSVVYPLVDVFGAAAVAVVAGVGVWWGPGWGLDAGELVACLFLVNLLLGPISELSEILDQTQTALAGWRKVLVLLAQPVELVEPVEGAELPEGALGVEVCGVGFSYRDGTPVLADIELSIAAGASVAIVGETGSGKSTLAKLLVRLADPDEGRVEVAGIALDQVAPEARRRAIRMVPQDGFLFDGTIGDNILAGRSGANRAQALAAIEALGLDRWLAGLPEGFDTPVGPRGERLSVGERQLVALARAELADPGLLVLDEATSAVDPETEQALSVALSRLARGRTTVSVAHRLSTAEQADLVVVVDGGRLVEVGPHAQLVAAGGAYAALHRAWARNTRPVTGGPG